MARLNRIANLARPGVGVSILCRGVQGLRIRHRTRIERHTRESYRFDAERGCRLLEQRGCQTAFLRLTQFRGGFGFTYSRDGSEGVGFGNLSRAVGATRKPRPGQPPASRGLEGRMRLNGANGRRGRVSWLDHERGRGADRSAAPGQPLVWIKPG